MQTPRKILVTAALALTISAPAGAVVSIDLVQVGGTYSAAVGANPGDTLALQIGYGLQPGDAVTLVDPGLVFDAAVSAFDPGASTETGFAAWSGGAVALNPIATGDIALTAGGIANGWEKGTTIAGGGSSPCVFGACTSLGTAAFVLSGTSGFIDVGGVGQPGGTVIGDGVFDDITGQVYLPGFTIIPEPTTASLLGLALLGLAAAHRRRKH